MHLGLFSLGGCDKYRWSADDKTQVVCVHSKENAHIGPVLTVSKDSHQHEP